MPGARDEPDVPLGEDLRRDDPDVRLARRERAGAVRAEHRHALGADVGVDAEHLVGGQALGDADDGADARVDGLVDRVGCKARRDEDHRRVRARLGDRVRDRVEDRDSLDVLAALARGHAGDDLGAVALVPEPVERSLGAGQALHEQLRVLVDDDRHQRLFRAFRTSFVSTYSSPSIWSASSSFTRARSSAGVSERSSHSSSGCRFSNDSTCSSSSPAASRNERHSCSV